MPALASFLRWRLLLYELARREFKGRYSSARLGVAWAILNPLLMMAVLTLVFSFVLKLPASRHPYPVFVLTGLLLWQCFSASVATATSSIIDDRQLMKKVPFPRSLIPLAIVLSNLLNFLVSLPILLGLMLLLGCPLHPTALLVPLLLVLLGLLSFGVGLCTSALAVYYRDVKYTIEPLLLVVFYGSPIFYSLDLVPARLRPLFDLNPLAGIIALARELLLDGRITSLAPLGSALCGTAVALALGTLAYRRYAPRFADML